MLEQITPLSASGWERAKTRARDMILSRMIKPERANYVPRITRKYPRWLTTTLLGCLIVIAGAAWFASAGKQILVVDTYLAPVVKNQLRLSSVWVDTSIILSLLMGEVGTLTFSLASAIFPGDEHRLGKFTIRPTMLIFRSAAVGCSMIALLSNVSITAIHAGDLQSISAFSWFMTIFTPSIVLVVGLLVERMVLAEVEAKSEADAAFKKDFDFYISISSNPENHPDYPNLHKQMIIEQLRLTSKNNRAVIDQMIESDPMIRAELIAREWRRNNWELVIIENPTRAPLPSGSQAQLPSKLTE